MKIVNNRIYIQQGETPTYKARIINKDNGSPYIVLDNIKNPFIEFSVRDSLYGKYNYLMRVFLNLKDTHKFPTSEIALYEEPDWDNDIGPSEGNEYKLHRKTTGVTDLYAYYSDEGIWELYDFIIEFPILRRFTIAAEAKSYWYEISLLGSDDYIDDDDILYNIPYKIKYKEVIQLPNEFFVGGSING